MEITPRKQMANITVAPEMAVELEMSYDMTCGSCAGGDHACDHDGCACEQCNE
jgi:hypothetical protein